MPDTVPDESDFDALAARVAALEQAQTPTAQALAALAGVPSQLTGDEAKESADIAAVLAQITTLAGQINQTPSAVSSVPSGTFSYIERWQTSTIARTSDGSKIISQGTSPAAVITAAMNAAGGNGGGFCRIGDGLFQGDAPMTIPAHVGLTGDVTLARDLKRGVGSVIIADGLGVNDTLLASGGNGAQVHRVGLHGNGQAGNTFAHLKGSDVKLKDAVVTGAVQHGCLHKPSSGSYAFTSENTDYYGNGDHNFYAPSGTDGNILGGRMLEPGSVNIEINAGGWHVHHLHATQSSKLTNKNNAIFGGSGDIVTSNYFDSCKNGPAVSIRSGVIFGLNEVKNQSSDNGWNLAIELSKAFGAIVALNYTLTAKGIGMQWTSTTGYPPSGIYGPNLHQGALLGFVGPDGKTPWNPAITPQLFASYNLANGS